MQIDHEGNARELKALPDGLNTIDGTLWIHLKRADLRAMRWLRDWLLCALIALLTLNGKLLRWLARRL